MTNFKLDTVPSGMILEHLGRRIEVEVFAGIDGRIVVAVDTPGWVDETDTGPDMRVYVNEGVVYGDDLSP